MKNINLKEEQIPYNLLFKENTIFRQETKIELNKTKLQLNQEIDRLNDNVTNVYQEANRITSLFNESNNGVILELKEFDKKVGVQLKNEERK